MAMIGSAALVPGVSSPKTKGGWINLLQKGLGPRAYDWAFVAAFCGVPAHTQPFQQTTPYVSTPRFVFSAHRQWRESLVQNFSTVFRSDTDVISELLPSMVATLPPARIRTLPAIPEPSLPTQQLRQSRLFDNSWHGAQISPTRHTKFLKCGQGGKYQ